LLSGLRTPEEIHPMLESNHIGGIVLHPGKEIKTGLNNFDDLADVLETLDTDEFATDLKSQGYGGC
jgi:phosphoribosylanthranilate isomerase